MVIPPQDRFHIDVVPEDAAALLVGLRESLLRTPREIPPRYFYDDAGSRLFEEITGQDEYYPTRTEKAILRQAAADIVARTRAHTLIELGSGAATKTRILLDAMSDSRSLVRYIPFDVSEGIVRRAAQELLREYPGLEVHAVVADFAQHLDRIPVGTGRLCIFLGGTIGNFRPGEAMRFLRGVSRRLAPGEHFLLGTDLVKSPGRLEAAYDDARGVTAAFNLNALRVVNRLLDGTFDPAGFRHRTIYNVCEAWIEMWLVSLVRQRVELPALDLEITLEKGEAILTEISAKYDRPRVEALLGAAGFALEEFYTDPEQLFALSLARRL